MSEIFINKMASQFKLVGYRESTIDVGITVGVYLDSDIPVEINTRAVSNSTKNVEIDVVYSGYKSINVELIPALHSNIPVEIEVNPHNKMSVYYELTQPPLSTYTGFSVEDAFVAERNPYAVMNYGSNNSMMIGNDHKGENISFVRFDTSVISDDVLIKSAKMRVYYSQLNGSSFELYRVIGKWRENSITYANMPTDLRLLTDDWTNDTDNRYIEFDVTDIVTTFIKGVVNEGFALKSANGASILRTREYPQAPELIVEYFSPSKLSVGNSRKLVELTVRQKNTSDIPVEIDIHSSFGFSYLPVTIFAKKPNDIFNSDISVELDTLAAPITIGHSDISVEIIPAWGLMSYIYTDIEVPLYDGNSDIPVDLTVRRNDKSVVNVDIEVPLYDGNSNVDVELTVQRYDDSIIPIDIEIPQYFGESNVIVEFNVGNYHDSDIEVDIEVPEYNGESLLHVDISVASHDKSSISVDIEVPIYDGESHISVEVGIIARETSYIPVEIEVQYKDGESCIPVEIALWEYTDSIVPVEIGVTRDSIDVGIVVPYYADSTVNVELLPRVEFLNEVSVELTVRRKVRYAYAFFI